MPRTTTAVLNGERRKDVEDWLEEKGVSYEFVPDLPLASIDRERSLHNQARLGEALNPQFVEEYREAMRRGDRFPALVVARSSAKGPAVNIDGNHRFEAATEEGHTAFGAYVVQLRSNSSLFKDMAEEANTRHGKPTSTEERVQQSLRKIRSGSSIEKAAADVNVPLSVVRTAWDRARVDERAASVGVKQSDWDTLVASVKLRLQALYTDEVFKAASRLAVSARLTTAEVDEVVSTVNSTRSTEKQLAAVRSLRRGYSDRISAAATGAATGARSTSKASPRRRFSLVLTNLMALPDNFGTSLHDTFDDTERRKAAQQAREASARLERLAADLEN